MNYLINKTQYLSAKQQWNNGFNRNSTDHLIYNLIRGFDLKRGFTETTNETKLNNGWKPWAGFDYAKESAKWRFRPASPYNSGPADYEQRMKDLSKTWGFEFTPELMITLREALK